MSSVFRAEVLDAAARWVRRNQKGTPAVAVVLALSDHAVHIDLTADQVAAALWHPPRIETPATYESTPAKAAGLPAKALWLSPLEAKICKALADRDWTRAHDVAALIGESETGDFRAVLRNLSERQILQSATGAGRGYRLPRQNGD